MTKDILCKKCEKKLGWYDTESRMINLYDKDSKIEYVGKIIVATVNCCEENQSIEIE